MTEEPEDEPRGSGLPVGKRIGITDIHELSDEDREPAVSRHRLRRLYRQYQSLDATDHSRFALRLWFDCLDQGLVPITQPPTHSRLQFQLGEGPDHSSMKVELGYWNAYEPVLIPCPVEMFERGIEGLRFKKD